MTLTEMTNDERSLLLYLETRAVDHSGAVDVRHMNGKDLDIAQHWNTTGFIEFGRIYSKDVQRLKSTHWVRLSDEAWRLVHEERKARSERTWERRSWLKASEK